MGNKHDEVYSKKKSNSTNSGLSNHSTGVSSDFEYNALRKAIECQQSPMVAKDACVKSRRLILDFKK